MACYHHLCYALAVVYDEFFSRQVDKKHHQLTTIVRVYCARAIQYCDTFLECQSTTRANLCLKALWQSHIQSCRNESSLHRFQYYRLFDVGTQVHACTLLGSIGWQRVVALVDDSDVGHC